MDELLAVLLLLFCVPAALVCALLWTLLRPQRQAYERTRMAWPSTRPEAWADAMRGGL